MDGLLAAELDAVAWRAIAAAEEVDVHGWRCKSSPDLPFRRANAVLAPTDASHEALAVGFEAVLGWCAARGQRVVVQVPDGRGGPVDRWLEGRGLAVEAPVDVLATPLALVPPPRPDAPAVEVSTGVDAAWARTSADLAGGDEHQHERTDAYARLLSTMGERALGAVAPHHERGASGVGFGIVDGRWLGIFGMATASAQRRRGVARAMLAALAERARALGATHAYLQVEVDNDAAHALYEGLGFARAHRYHYRSLPGPGEATGC